MNLRPSHKLNFPQVSCKSGWYLSLKQCSSLPVEYLSLNLCRYLPYARKLKQTQATILVSGNI